MWEASVPAWSIPTAACRKPGAFVDDVAVAVQRGKFYPLTPWERETTMVVDYCSAACFLTTREIFDRVSGFDPIFEPAYYEDVDLCLKIACLGLFVYYCPQVEIVHIENATSADQEVGRFSSLQSPTIATSFVLAGRITFRLAKRPE